MVTFSSPNVFLVVYQLISIRYRNRNRKNHFMPRHAIKPVKTLFPLHKTTICFIAARS